MSGLKNVNITVTVAGEVGKATFVSADDPPVSSTQTTMISRSGGHDAGCEQQMDEE